MSLGKPDGRQHEAKGAGHLEGARAVAADWPRIENNRNALAFL
jgi:hypothetical protein